MKTRRINTQINLLASVIVLFAQLFLNAQVQAAKCPLTLPSSSPVETGFFKNPDSSHDWYGNSSLAAYVPKSGQWIGMGEKRNYGDKFWWYSNSYDAREDYNANITLTARRLFQEPLEFSLTSTTGGFNDNWNAMLLGMEFPASGCWEIIGRYRLQELKLVISVGEAPEPSN